MLTSETLSRIRKIQIYSRKLVSNHFAGAYHAVFKGRGITFDNVRPYTPGDNIRDIDWNVTARMGEPFVKQYVEERELTVILAIDTSASMHFGTRSRTKHALAAELSAVLAYAAIQNNDQVGLILFGEKIEKVIPPRKGRNHILRIIRELLVMPSAGAGTNLGLAIQTLQRTVPRRAIIFILSDFLAPIKSYQSSLVALNQRHDVIAVILTDPLEQQWPAVGIVRVQDAETGHISYVDTGSSRWRQLFIQRVDKHRDMRDKLLARSGIDRLEIVTNQDYISALSRFFQQRAQRIGR